MDQPTRGWKSDEDRGVTGAWFVRAIGERSIEQVAKDMADRGHVHKPDYYRGIMAGTKKPGRVLLRALTEYLDSSPDAATAPPSTDLAQMAALVTEMREQNVIAREQAAAIKAQADAINRLVDRLELAERRPTKEQELAAQTKVDEETVRQFLADNPEVSRRLQAPVPVQGEP